jgi:hypothetical protein
MSRRSFLIQVDLDAKDRKKEEAEETGGDWRIR